MGGNENTNIFGVEEYLHIFNLDSMQSNEIKDIIEPAHE